MSAWLAQLSDADDSTRQEASRALAAIGAPAVPALVHLVWEDTTRPPREWGAAAAAIMSMCPQDTTAIRVARDRAQSPRERGQLDTLLRGIIHPDSFPIIADTGFNRSQRELACMGRGS